MKLRSLQGQIVLGLMACVGLSVLAFGVLLAIAFQFRDADARSRDAVDRNRAAALLDQRARGAEVALYRYLYSVDGGDREVLTRQLRDIASAEGGPKLGTDALAASDLIQRSQVASVALLDSSGGLSAPVAHGRRLSSAEVRDKIATQAGAGRLVRSMTVA